MVGLALMLTAVAGSVAQGKIVFIHGKAYGVQFKPGAAALSHYTVGGPQPPLTYGGGPLMLSSKLYLIFWGPKNSFAKTYSGPIIQWAKDLATDHLKTTNEFSVGELYKDGHNRHISTNLAYGGTVFDTTKYPPLDTANGCNAANKPCVTDPQLQNEILNQINAQNWPVDPAGAPVAQYLMLTPVNVNSCMGPGSCTFSPTNGFCAYHSQITGLTPPPNGVATYSILPYESGCDSGQAPPGTDGNADADGTLDSAIHEVVESTTDPSGGTGYTDSNGLEIGDKCTFPVVTTQATIYGTPLGGSLGAFTAYNQLIGGHSYYTQMLWANDPTKTPPTTAQAGCIQRIGPSPSFAAPSSAHRGVKVSFDGSKSTEVLHPITSYVWNYGDGSPTTTGSHGSHVYHTTGTFTVTLTVRDATGATNASTERRPVRVT